MSDVPAIWDDVYGRFDEADLPWTGIDFPPQLQDILATLPRHRRLIVTGCGTGFTVERMRHLGFGNLVGADVSMKAIIRARQSYPGCHFIHAATEEFPAVLPERANILDWMVLHHVTPCDLASYLGVFSSLAETICLAYPYDPVRPERQSGVKAEGAVYSHCPRNIAMLLPTHRLLVSTLFEFTLNGRFNPAAARQPAQFLCFERGHDIER